MHVPMKNDGYLPDHDGKNPQWDRQLCFVIAFTGTICKFTIGLAVTSVTPI